jgi:elongation factor G
MALCAPLFFSAVQHSNTPLTPGMKLYEAADIRNFAIVGHQATGKTILSDAILMCSGKIHRIGSIQAGTTVSDYHASEKERQISVHASLLHTEWMGRKFNVIDTPGYQDFISEGLGALRVGDFALVVVSATSGVELGTRQVWTTPRATASRRWCGERCDKEHTQYESVVEQLRQAFGANLLPMNVPINPGPGFNKVLDVMRMEVVTYAGDGSGSYTEERAEGELRDRVRELHQQVIEYVAESDDSLMEKFFENDGLSEDELRAGMHHAIQNQRFIPIFSTSGATNVGVARLLDFIAKYGSSPVDRRSVEAMDESGKAVTVNLEDPPPAATSGRRSANPTWATSPSSASTAAACARHGAVEHRSRPFREAGAGVRPSGARTQHRRGAARGRHRRGGETARHAYGQHAVGS